LELIQLKFGDYLVCVDPPSGGSVAAFRWRGQDVLRPQTRPGVLESASFPLVPFCNRITGGCFKFAGRTVSLSPNHPCGADEPAMHGFGWILPWKVEARGPAAVALALDFPGGAWPWSFRAVQELSLDPDGLLMRLTLTNLADEAMPAGLGFHPYFPRDRATLYHGLHRAELHQNGKLSYADNAIDWWDSTPVNTRLVDTAYAGRVGPLEVTWPDRGLGTQVTSSGGLDCTHVYVPRGDEFFCVEPVSHLPNRTPSQRAAFSMKVLDPGQAWSEWIRLRAHAAPPM
jgi:aldose 1-epimerase